MHTAVRYEEAEFSPSLKKGTVALMQTSYRKHVFCIYLFILLCKKNSPYHVAILLIDLSK